MKTLFIISLVVTVVGAIIGVVSGMIADKKLIKVK